jgi:hypothetical protein
MNRTFTIQAKAVEKIVRSAAASGVDADHLYKAVNLDPSVLLDPDNRIPFAQIVDLYEKAAQLTGDNNFGLHVGETVNPTAFDVVGYCALNSPTLGERRKSSERTSRLVFQDRVEIGFTPHTTARRRSDRLFPRSRRDAR